MQTDLKKDQKGLNANIIKIKNLMSSLTTDQKDTESNRVAQKKRADKITKEKEKKGKEMKNIKRH